MYLYCIFVIKKEFKNILLQYAFRIQRGKMEIEGARGREGIPRDLPDGLMEDGSVDTTASDWIVFGKPFPRSEVRFFGQIIILYIVIIACLINLSVGKGKLDTLWISVLCSSLGTLLPSPRFSRKTKEQTVTASHP